MSKLNSHSYFFAFLLVLTGLGLTACPHIAYKSMQEQMEKAKELNNRKPNYSQRVSDAVDITAIENSASADSISTDSLKADQSHIPGKPAPSGINIQSDSIAKKDVPQPNSTNQTLPTQAEHSLDQSDPLAMEKTIKKARKMRSVFDNNLKIDSNQSLDSNKQKNDSVVSNTRTIDNAWKVKIKSLDDSKYPKFIEMRVQILDTAGRSIVGLAPPNYKGKGNWKDYWSLLNDSCNSQEIIKNFTVEEITQKNDTKNAIAFVLDHSGSMGQGKIYLLNRALARILTALNRQDYVSVIKFANDNYVQIPLSNDKRYYVTTFKDQLDEDFNIGGGTKMYNALHTGINELKKAPEGFRRSLILLSDGGDSSPRTVLDSAVKACKDNNISIISIDFDYDNELMREVALFTGGTYYKIYSIKEFPFVFRDLYYSLNNHYFVRYSPPECAGKHKVNLEVSSPYIAKLKGSDIAYYDKSIITKFDAAGTTAILNIEFETGSADLSENSKKHIKQIYDVLTNNPDIRLAINGHTDDVGSDKDNYKLSLARAKSVKSALVKLGINPERLETEGFGENSSLVPNDSEENRKLNRRTEFIVIDND